MINATTPAVTGVAAGIVIQADGKIIVCGTTQNASNNDAFVVRYHGDGTLDESFGGTGKVVIDLLKAYCRIEVRDDGVGGARLDGSAATP